MSTFRIILAIVLLSVGMLFILLSVIGVFRMKFVMNRMHAAALGDTCGLLFMILGLICIGGLCGIFPQVQNAYITCFRSSVE